MRVWVLNLGFDKQCCGEDILRTLIGHFVNNCWYRSALFYRRLLIRPKYEQLKHKDCGRIEFTINYYLNTKSTFSSYFKPFGKMTSAPKSLQVQQPFRV